MEINQSKQLHVNKLIIFKKSCVKNKLCKKNHMTNTSGIHKSHMKNNLVFKKNMLKQTDHMLKKI